MLVRLGVDIIVQLLDGAGETVVGRSVQVVNRNPRREEAVIRVVADQTGGGLGRQAV